MEVLSHLGSRRFYRLLVVYTVVQVYVRYLPCRRVLGEVSLVDLSFE
jgi:hypothetical protein